jgi:hypothetical protein
MPRESYKYIPMSILNELILEFRLNPFAMFTSGYNDDPKILSYNNTGVLGTSSFSESYTDAMSTK